MGLDGPLSPVLADGRQAEADRAGPADDGRRGVGLRSRGGRREDGGPADEPRRGRAAGDAVRGRGARDGTGAGDGDAATGARLVTSGTTTPAVGGERNVPVPDPF